MAKVTCIGVGTVGSAWGAVFARAGHEVRLYDAAPGTVTGFALPRIRETLEQLQEALPTGESIATIEARLKVCETLAEAVGDADYVQESVREDVAVKRAAFDEIGRLAPVTALLMSSTSAIPGSQFLSGVPHPERALVAHPINPPSHIPLVELCGTGLTGEAQIEAARAFHSANGMEPIVVNREIDGFILNRLQYALVGEAMHLVGEGYCSAEDIDRVMTGALALRWASIGPFMTAHLNARGGFAGFVEQLGPMMRRMGSDAKTDYDWSPEQAREIAAWLEAKQPVDTIPQAQAWRDRRILAVRSMQAKDAPPTE